MAAKKPVQKGKTLAETPATLAPVVDAARVLLREKLDEALVDARAEVRAIERLAERLA